MMVDHIGQQLGNYRLIRLLGEGGFAEVYLGEHIHLGTHAAIKVLHTQLTSNDVEQFRTEARIIARLEHPHIVRVLDFGVEDKSPFLVMSYAPNGTLRQRYAKGESLSLATIVLYVKQIASALQYAHDEKLIHRDIKPENMLLGRNDDVLLSDFGIALVTQSSRHQSTQDVVGTVAYMAPEQLQGKPRPASDQYSLGIVVYEWLCGERPFHGSFTELCAQQMFVPPPSLREKVPELPTEVELVVLATLAKDPQRRFTSVQAFATALEQASRLTQFSTFTPPILSFEQTISPIPPSQHVRPSVDIPSSSQPVQSDVVKAPPIEQDTPKRGFSRRAVLTGIGGLAIVSIVGSITWLAVSQKPGVPHGSANSYYTPTATPTSHPTHTTTPISNHAPGTTFLTYRGHTNWIAHAAWSPNSTRIASGAADNTVQVWDAATGGNVLIYRGHSAGVNRVPWSPDGKHIASGSSDNTVQIWDAVTGRNILTYSGHNDIVRAVAWSPDGKLIVSGSHDMTVQVWDASNGTAIFTYRGHSNRVTSVAWSLDGKRIVSGSDDHTAQIWDATTGGNILIYHGHSDIVRAVAWSPNGINIVSGSHDTTVQVWQAISGNTVVTYHGHSQWVYTATWSLDGRHIASAGVDDAVQVWDAATGSNAIIYRGHPRPVNTASWVLDGSQRIASAGEDMTVQVWQAL